MSEVFREHDEIRRVDKKCVEAIDDIMNRMRGEYKKTHGCDVSINFRQASRVLGVKYFKNNLGKMKLEEALVEALVRGTDAEIPVKHNTTGEV